MYVWFHRRDLRTTDMRLFDKLRSLHMTGIHLLVIDPILLDERRAHEHSGRHFLQQVSRLQQYYQQANQQLVIVYGSPDQVLLKLASHYPLQIVAFHEDLTPYAKQRDQTLFHTARACGLETITDMDHMLIDADSFDHFTNRDQPYKVFTPFYSKWKQAMHLFAEPPMLTSLTDLVTVQVSPSIVEAFTLPVWLYDALKSTSPSISTEDPQNKLQQFFVEKLPDYEQGRDRYGWSYTSQMSGYINTGAISIRQVYEQATLTGSSYVDSWIRQLAWRDFYLYQALRNPNYFSYEKNLDWSGFSTAAFDYWAEARTGIPIIDAAMTQLKETGEMPNRLRMVTAMFLTKQLLCPFFYGEAYFRDKLADYDHVLNRGGWLWSSSLGYDAAPYFRIMNPVRQSETYDPSGAYIRRWLPQLAHLSDKAIHQPQTNAIVDLKQARLRAIEQYSLLLKQNK
ncbi:cryptochrome/photolyase family protein [Paenibacillus arenosi]|uniref:Deoxyribodipyrimidine photo-lyase n=1 Tax=Paenibacillus arenosi TaxID=2774142 RepID=A0ABR9B2A7_9BACL|nr:deoxyribodipyrimidine photo-lyase [Paenibacillus arenosi]MBD8500489.1 deoxyribodipyrimidine photo-lyase [Paenibacillus arenosi]